MTSADTPPEGFETKSVPGYVPAVVPAGGNPITEGVEPGFSNTLSGDPAAAESAAKARRSQGDALPEGDQAADGGSGEKSTGTPSTGTAKTTTTKATGSKSS